MAANPHPTPCRGQAQGAVDADSARPGERDARRDDGEGQRELEAAVRGPDPLRPMDTDDRVEHDADDRRAPERGEEAQRQQQPSARLAEPGEEREQTARVDSRSTRSLLRSPPGLFRPNHPNSFWVPWPISSAPGARRMNASPTFTLTPSSVVSIPSGAVDDSGISCAAWSEISVRRRCTARSSRSTVAPSNRGSARSPTRATCSPRPTARWIAFRGARRDALEGHPEGRICLVGVDGSELRQLTNGPHDDDQPRWSPDGGTLTFRSDRAARADTSSIDCPPTRSARRRRCPRWKVSPSTTHGRPTAPESWWWWPG